MDDKMNEPPRIVGDIKLPDNYELKPGMVTYVPEVKEWQPIETAPKDGSRILAVEWASTEIHYGIVSISGSEWELVDQSGKGLGRGFYPTHWMHLPLPPTPKALRSSEMPNGEGEV